MKKEKWFYIFVLLWALLQLIIIIAYYHLPFGPDAKGYESHAISCYNLGSTYPSINNLYDTYIQAPGLVNALIPVYAIFHSVRPFFFLNLLMNVAILFEIVYLGKKFFSDNVGYLSGVIYALLLSNVFAPANLCSEVHYLFLSLSGFCLSLKDKPISQILAGGAYALAYTVRPLVLAFVVASIVYHLVRKIKKINPVLLLLTFCLILCSIASYNYKKVGTPLISSSTGGYNLLMTANDHATPLPNHSIYYDKDGFAHSQIVGHLTFYEKNNKWKQEAIAWIKKHPGRYLLLCVERVGVMFNKDVWSVPSLLGNLDNPDYAIKSGSKYKIILCQLIKMGYSLWYYLIIIFFVASICKNRKWIFSKKGVLLLIFALGVGGTCLFPMEHRYHYPYMFIVAIWAAAYLVNLRYIRKLWICLTIKKP